MKILLTGFQPFGGETINPALEAVKTFSGQTIAGAEIVTSALPVSWRDALPTFFGLLIDHKPDIVINVGQAGGRAKITPEQVGINLTYGKDNDGEERSGEPVVKNGPDAYFTNLPVTEMVKAMNEAHIPAAVSYSAGTYLCNFMAYAVRYHAARYEVPYKSCFIHIPYLPEQVINKPHLTPSMSLEMVIAGLRKCLEVAALAE